MLCQLFVCHFEFDCCIAYLCVNLVLECVYFSDWFIVIVCYDVDLIRFVFAFGFIYCCGCIQYLDLLVVGCLL